VLKMEEVSEQMSLFNHLTILVFNVGLRVMNWLKYC